MQLPALSCEAVRIDCVGWKLIELTIEPDKVLIWSQLLVELDKPTQILGLRNLGLRHREQYETLSEVSTIDRISANGTLSYPCSNPGNG